nr:MAG TPA: hypothetical protein [Microviridae sp.]
MFWVIQFTPTDYISMNTSTRVNIMLNGHRHQKIMPCSLP